jgi:hypothetical protein
VNRNQYERSRNILKALTQGVHPTTREDLPKDTIVNDIDVNRALTTAITALETLQARLLRRAMLPPDVGKTWSADEEAALARQFKSGISIADIVKDHKRTIRAIEARLERIGLMTAAERTTNNSFTGPPKGNSGEDQ